MPVACFRSILGGACRNLLAALFANNSVSRAIRYLPRGTLGYVQDSALRAVEPYSQIVLQLVHKLVAGGSVLDLSGVGQ